MIELTPAAPLGYGTQLARALMAGTPQPSATYGRDQPEDPQLGLVSALSTHGRFFARAIGRCKKCAGRDCDEDEAQLASARFS